MKRYTTWTAKSNAWVLQGAKSVHIRQPGDGAYSKRFATFVPLVFGDGTISEKITVIFRGQGKRITEVEKKS